MNKYLLVTLFLAGGLIASSAYAYQGNPNVPGPNYNAERHNAMQTAFQTGNYNLWKANVPANSKPARTITSETFSKFAQMRILMLQGKTEEANKIKTELGLNNAKQGCGCAKNSTNSTCQCQKTEGKACGCGQKGNCQKTTGTTCGCNKTK